MTDKTTVTCGYCNQPLPRFAQRCPRCEQDVTLSGSESPRKSTILEQIPDEFRKGNGRSSESAAGAASKSEGVVPYRPVCRPRRAMLCIVDDGSEDGEWVRIRTGVIRIGRTEGDVVISDDPKISGKHVEIRREQIGGYARWVLRDQKSFNGTFVRVESAKLVADSELMIGLRRFAFRMPDLAAPAEQSNRPMMTQGWAIASAVRTAAPKLVELESETPLEFALTGTAFKIGSSSTDCNLVIGDDPTVDPIHAEIYQEDNGDWKLTARRSLNGTWMRVEEVVIDRTCRFQAGEQRFKFRVQ